MKVKSGSAGSSGSGGQRQNMRELLQSSTAAERPAASGDNPPQ